MLINYRVILNVLGLLLIFNGLFMTLCIPASLYFNPDDIVPIALSFAITIGLGTGVWALTRSAEKPNIRKREGFAIVSFGWLVMSLSGTLPYILSGSVVSFTDAFFETMSGYTTTGASILSDLTVIPKDILLWRSLTQWIGGMGIIVLAVAILPVLGIGGMQLFAAEAPGISTDKITPRISGTAKRLWFIYVGLTIVEISALKLAGMTWFDAICHSFTTMATGGFGTQNDSVASYSPLIQYIIILFMILAGLNFVLYYFILKRSWGKVFKNDELWAYLGLMAVTTGGATIAVLNYTDLSLEASFRIALFQISSIVTSTGFATADYTHWGSAMNTMFFVLLFSGAMAGSTSGGIKVIRHVVLAKNAWLEIKRQLHSSAIIPVRINGRAIHQDVVNQVISFIFMYLIMFLICSFGVTLTGVDMDTSMSAVATCMGNIGPGIANVSPSFNFSPLSDVASWILSFSMLLGRLELFTVLILFTPYFWSRH